jgi:hypothetical protein
VRAASHIPAKTPRVATAKEALDQLEIQDEEIDRMSALLSPGTTIIVIDQGYSRIRPGWIPTS